MSTPTTSQVMASMVIYRIGKSLKGEFCQLGTLGFTDEGDPADAAAYMFKLERYVHTHLRLMSFETFERLSDFFPPDLVEKVRQVFDSGELHYATRDIAQVREWAKNEITEDEYRQSATSYC